MNTPELMQSEELNAPWNTKDNPTIKVRVLVSAVISKSTEIDVNDYTVSEENKINFENCDLRETALQQIQLPKNWDIDDIEVMLDE